MGGLPNGRRGGRTSFLMITALFACISVLGFNYWVSRSHNLELQTKLYELEGEARQIEGERQKLESIKKELEEMIQRQKEQMNFIETSYRTHEEEADSQCHRDKEILQNNITSSTQLIYHQKNQLNIFNGVLAKLGNDVKDCKSNIEAVNTKCKNDIDQCESQVHAEEEKCNEKVAAAKLEVEEKMKMVNPAPVASQDNAGDADVKENVNLSEPKDKEPVNNGTNGDKVEVLTEKDPSINKEDLNPQEKAVESKDEENAIENVPPENKEMVDINAVLEDPGMEGLLTDQEATDAGLTDPEEDDYEPDERGLEKQEQGMEKAALNDYNGNDDNEGEFEADKQAELAGN